MSWTRLKSSHYKTVGDKIDPDNWLTSKDGNMMVQVRVHTDGILETIYWRYGKTKPWMVTMKKATKSNMVTGYGDTLSEAQGDARGRL